MKENPLCPKCGSVMILRKATSGKYTGKNFYRCSRHPECKVIVNIGDSNKESLKDVLPKSSTNLPTKKLTILKSRERVEGYNSMFFQSIAVPQELLSLVNEQEEVRRDLYFSGQWRLDYPTIEKTKLDNEMLDLVSPIAKKILTRGRVTLLSKRLEEKIKQLFFTKEINMQGFNFDSYYALPKPTIETSFWFDGNKFEDLGNLSSEHFFYEKILSYYLGPYFKRFVLPQVEFSSFIETSEKEKEISQYQRVDFIITTQKGAYAIEIDGQEHNEHKERDNNRDKFLQQNGFTVIRIPNEEILERKGRNLDLLIEVLEDKKVNEVKDFSFVDKYVLSVKLAHQIQVAFVEAVLSNLVKVSKNEIKICFDVDSVSLESDCVKKILGYLSEDLSALIENL